MRIRYIIAYPGRENFMFLHRDEAIDFGYSWTTQVKDAMVFDTYEKASVRLRKYQRGSFVDMYPEDRYAD